VGFTWAVQAGVTKADLREHRESKGFINSILMDIGMHSTQLRLDLIKEICRGDPA
jgi:hypothetical protein